MQPCLHEVNQRASQSVYAEQLGIDAGLWHNERMKLKLREWRHERGLTIDQLAELSGVSKGYISLLENGRRQPSADALQTLAASLRIRIADLIDEAGLDPDLATLISVISALSKENRAKILKQAAAMLPQRAS